MKETPKTKKSSVVKGRSMAANIRWNKFYDRKIDDLAKKVQVIISNHVRKMYAAEGSTKKLDLGVLAVEIAQSIIKRKVKKAK